MSAPIPPEISSEVSSFWQSYKWVIIIVASCVAIGYLSVLFLGKNNPVELEIEKVIEAETGVHVDLTP